MDPCGRLGCGRGGRGGAPGRVVDGECQRGLAGDLAGVAGHPEPHGWPRGVALPANHNPVGDRVLWGSISNLPPPDPKIGVGKMGVGVSVAMRPCFSPPPLAEFHSFICDLCLDGGEELVDWERGWEREPLKWSFSKQLKGTTPPPPSNLEVSDSTKKMYRDQQPELFPTRPLHAGQNPYIMVLIIHYSRANRCGISVTCKVPTCESRTTTPRGQLSPEGREWRGQRQAGGIGATGLRGSRRRLYPHAEAVREPMPLPLHPCPKKVRRLDAYGKELTRIEIPSPSVFAQPGQK